MSEPTTSSSSVPSSGRPYLGPTGRSWLLPLYDPFSRVLGARSVHQRLVDAADLRPGSRVLEIGCGTGNLALLAKARQPAATVVGLDPDVAALARARRKARRRGLELQLDHGFADQLPYPEASLDRVLSALMFHHLPADQKPAALREALRVLRPGGELHLVDLSGQQGGHMHLLLPHAARLADQPGDPVSALLREAGFSDVRSEGSTGRLPLTWHRAIR